MAEESRLAATAAWTGDSDDLTEGETQLLLTAGERALIATALQAGDAGIEGDSAYEVAVSEGFIGNESQWLASLEGTDGADGGVQEVVADTTPQLGGNLDGNQKKIENFLGSSVEKTANYTTVNSDSGRPIFVNSASAVTITIHAAAPKDFNLIIYRKGAGAVTLASSGGNVRGISTIADQYGALSAYVESNAGSAPEVYGA